MNETSTFTNKSILFVFAGSEIGGAERQGLLLARHLRSKCGARVQVWGVAAEREGSVTKQCTENDIVWRPIPFSWPQGHWAYLRAFVRFAFQLRAARPDIILAYTWLPNVLCGLTWRFSGALAFYWNQRDEGLELTKSFWHRAAVCLTDKFVANAAAGRDFLVRTYGLKPAQITLIPNGVMLPAAKQNRHAWRQQLGLSNTQLVACMIGSLHPYKDHRTLIEAWALVLEASPAKPLPVLLLAGRFAGEAEALQSLADVLCVRENVHFLDSVEDVAGLLGAVDICLHSSRSEGCPNAVLEAMASGLPVVATDIAGVREAVGMTGAKCLVPPGDARAFADRILGMLSDPAGRKELGGQLRSRCLQQFAVESMLISSVKLLQNDLRFADGQAGAVQGTS